MAINQVWFHQGMDGNVCAHQDYGIESTFIAIYKLPLCRKDTRQPQRATKLQDDYDDVCKSFKAK